MKKINITDQVLYARPVGTVEANKMMINLIGEENIEGRTVDRLLSGRSISVYQITRKELDSFLDSQGRGALRLDTFFGAPGEREIFEAVMGVQSSDLSIKSRIDLEIKKKLLAIKTSSKSRKIKVTRKPYRSTAHIRATKVGQ